MKSLAGHLLIAPQQERDLDFMRTVILLIQHSEEQAFGVVLNRPTTTTARQTWRGKWLGLPAGFWLGILLRLGVRNAWFSRDSQKLSEADEFLRRSGAEFICASVAARSLTQPLAGRTQGLLRHSHVIAKRHDTAVRGHETYPFIGVGVMFGAGPIERTSDR